VVGTLVCMNGSRALRETVIRALAKVGLVWAVAVLGFLFTGMTALSQHADSYTLSSARDDARASSFTVTADQAPHTAGLVLALLVLGGGVLVLAVGATRGEREPELRYAAADDTPDLSLALGLGLFG
jgi:hypothetical protein